MIAKLIDKQDGKVAATFVSDADFKAGISGIVKETISWDENNKPYEENFFASIHVKWDGCSHFWFYGQDYDKETESEKDSGYHICGIIDYINHMRIMHFAYEIMIHKVGFDNILEKEEYANLKLLNLLNDYEIKYEQEGVK